MVDQSVKQGKVGRCTSPIMELVIKGKVRASLDSPQVARGFRKTNASARQKVWRWLTQRWWRRRQSASMAPSHWSSPRSTKGRAAKEEVRAQPMPSPVKGST
jgi:hypothetical protein